MRGDLHLFLGLQLRDILLEEGLLAIVVAASVGRGVAMVRPLLQDHLLTRAHTTKIYYSQPYFITQINTPRTQQPRVIAKINGMVDRWLFEGRKVVWFGNPFCCRY